jgi:hypothetical protein
LEDDTEARISLRRVFPLAGENQNPVNSAHPKQQLHRDDQQPVHTCTYKRIDMDDYSQEIVGTCVGIKFSFWKKILT